MLATTARKVLTWVLRLLGVVAASALFTAVMPTGWMAAANDALGLEPYQSSPLMEYLTRSLSAVYALLGALTLYASREVERYLDLISFMGRLVCVLGVFLTAVAFWAGLPPAWAWVEGPLTVVLGLVMTWLARRAGAGAGAGPR